MKLSQKRKAIVEEFAERTASGEGRIRFYNQIEEINWLEKVLNEYTEKVTKAVKDWYTLPPKYRTKARLLEELSK